MTDAQRKGKVSSFTSSHKTPSDFAFGEIAPIALYSSTLSRPWRRGLIVYARKTPPTHTSLSPFSPKVMLSSVGRVRASKSTISNILYRESIVCKTVLYYAKKCNVFCHQGYPYHPRLRQPGKKGLSLVARSVLESPANGQLIGNSWACLWRQNLKPFLPTL